MSDQEKQAETGEQPKDDGGCCRPGERFRRHLEDEWMGGARLSLDSVLHAARDMERQVEDAVYATVPPDVTRHLVNSKKELLMAGRRMIDLAMERLDAAAARAEEIHRAEAERRAAPAPPAEPPPSEPAP